jgi:hypothetical protein
MIFYIAIVFYISSVIGALILMIAGKNISVNKLIIPGAIHAVLLILFFLTRHTASNNEEQPVNFFLLLFICSGVSLCGIVWRLKALLPIRIYFSVFAITFPLFLFSPSRLVNLLLTGAYADTSGKSFLISGNVFLEQQNSWSGNSNGLRYKIIRKKGMFHETLARDVVFKGPIDSIRAILFKNGDTAILRGYTIHESYVALTIDSQDVNISLRSKKRNTIERRLK